MSGGRGAPNPRRAASARFKAVLAGRKRRKHHLRLLRFPPLIVESGQAVFNPHPARHAESKGGEFKFRRALTKGPSQSLNWCRLATKANRDDANRRRDRFQRLVRRLVAADAARGANPNRRAAAAIRLRKKSAGVGIVPGQTRLAIDMFETIATKDVDAMIGTDPNGIAGPPDQMDLIGTQSV